MMNDTNRYHKISLTVSVSPGAHIRSALLEAKRLSEDIGMRIEMRFNGTPIIVSPATDIEWELSRYDSVLKSKYGLGCAKKKEGN